jgi:hypothetical protein
VVAPTQGRASLALGFRVCVLRTRQRSASAHRRERSVTWADNVAPLCQRKQREDCPRSDAFTRSINAVPGQAPWRVCVPIVGGSFSSTGHCFGRAETTLPDASALLARPKQCGTNNERCSRPVKQWHVHELLSTSQAFEMHTPPWRWGMEMQWVHTALAAGSSMSMWPRRTSWRVRTVSRTRPARTARRSQRQSSTGSGSTRVDWS